MKLVHSSTVTVDPTEGCDSHAQVGNVNLNLYDAEKSKNLYTDSNFCHTQL